MTNIEIAAAFTNDQDSKDGLRAKIQRGAGKGFEVNYSLYSLFDAPARINLNDKLFWLSKRIRLNGIDARVTGFKNVIDAKTGRIINRRVEVEYDNGNTAIYAETTFKKMIRAKGLQNGGVYYLDADKVKAFRAGA